MPFFLPRVTDLQTLAHRCARAHQIGNELLHPDGERAVGEVGVEDQAEIGRGVGPVHEVAQVEALCFKQFKFEQHFGGVGDVLFGLMNKAVQPLAGGSQRGLRSG